MARTGRPVEFSEDLEEAAWKYVNGGWEKEDHAFPSLVGLCKVINRAKSTIYDWAKRDDNNFSDILQAINENQELIAFSRGMKGEYNANLVKLLLGKHGYHDKQDTTHAAPDGGPIKHDWIIEPILPNAESTDT